MTSGIGIVSATMGVGGSMGMIVTGLIADHTTSYRPEFWIAAVLAAAGLVMVAVSARDVGVRTGGRPDYAGATLLAGLLVCLLLAISEGNAWGWASGGVLALFAATVVLTVAWVLVELRVAQPLVRLSLLVGRQSLSANFASLLLGFSMYAAFTLISTFVQTPKSVGYGLGGNVLDVGLYMLPSTVTMLVFSALAGRIAARVGAAYSMAIGSVFAGLSYMWLALSHSHVYDMLGFSAVQGIGFGIAYAALGTLAVQHVPMDQSGIASGVNSLVRTAGGSVSGAVIAAVLTGETIRGLPGVPTLHAYVLCFVVVAIGAWLAAGVAVVHGRGTRRGATASKRSRRLDVGASALAIVELPLWRRCTWAPTRPRTNAVSVIRHGSGRRPPRTSTGDAARRGSWTTAPPPFYRWFTGGELNTCHNALDRHVERGAADQPALIYDSPVTGTQRTYTYRELRDEVAALRRRAARPRRRQGRPRRHLHADDPGGGRSRCSPARGIGAVHSVVFGGFAARELAARIDDAQPKVVVSASCGIEGSRVVEYKPLLDAALDRATHQAGHVVIVQRPQAPAELVERPRRRLGRGHGRRAEPAELRAGGGDRPAVHPLHVGHDRPAEGDRARQRRARGRPALVDARTSTASGRATCSGPPPTSGGSSATPTSSTRRCSPAARRSCTRASRSARRTPGRSGGSSPSTA